MSGRLSHRRLCGLVGLALVCTTLAFAPPPSSAQQRREREPNSVYSARRANLAEQVDAPIVLWGYTGKEDGSQAYVFSQEENFYYLTGHNEEGAGLILMPAAKSADGSTMTAVPRDSTEILFLPKKDPQKEKVLSS